MIPLWKPVSEEFEGIGQGSATEELEKKIAAFLGMKYAVAVSNGTAALFLALKAYGVGPGNRVLVPDLTAIATANAVSMTGAEVVLWDVNKNGNLNIEDVPPVDVVIPVHFNGRLAKIPKDVTVIEDGCQAFGTYGVGRSGCACFSFSPTKTIFTGQGGMVVTNYRWLYDTVKMLRDQGRRGKEEVYLTCGYNLKFTDLQAIIALIQYDLLPTILERKREVYKLYYEALHKYMLPPNDDEVIWLPDIYFPPNDDEVIWLPDIYFYGYRDKMQRKLVEEGVSSRKFYPPIHTQQPYLTKKSFTRAEFLSETGLWLPSRPSDDEIAYICKTVNKLLR